MSRSTRTIKRHGADELAHRILSSLEACALLHVSRSTFLRLQAAWTPSSPAPFPQPIRVSTHQFVWDEADLLRWRRAHRRWRYAGIFAGPQSELLTTSQIIDALSIPPERLRNYRTREDFPPPVDQVGRSPLWTREIIRSWIRNAEVISQQDLLPKKTDWQ